MASNLHLPRYIALGLNPEFNYSNPNGSYLSYAREDVETDAIIQFLEKNAESPYAKFELEFATAQGLFHIRSCQSNRYWERKKVPSDKYLITATANKKEEDQSNESCTLFKFISVDTVTSTVRIVHVQSGNYLSALGSDDTKTNYQVSADTAVDDDQGRDIFHLIDWSSLLILPRYVAFKGNNGKYLCLRNQDPDHPYMQFATEDIGDSTVLEIFVTDDGSVRIKTLSNSKFWRRSPSWIWADADDTSSNDKDTLFRPVKVDNKTIGLINLGNNYFCKRLTSEGNTDCLYAAVPSLTQDAQLTVVEPVLTREIYDVKYNLDYSRVYDESVLVVATNSASNYNIDPIDLEVKLSYRDTKTSTWNNMFSRKLGLTDSLSFSIPLIKEGKIELSSEIQTGIEWGETKTSTTVVEVVRKVAVPPMKKVTVNLVATKGTCDVPFTYMQKDTLYDEKEVTSEIEGGTYTGSNYYKTHFETKEEDLEPEVVQTQNSIGP